MTVKEVYKRIEDLKYDRQNFMNIQEFCLGHMSSNEDVNNGVHTKIRMALEEGAELNESLRSLASKTIVNIDNEIARLTRIIENTHVKID